MSSNPQTVVWFAFPIGTELPDYTPGGVYIGEEARIYESDEASPSRRFGFGHPFSAEDIAFLRTVAGGTENPHTPPTDWRYINTDLAAE